MQISLAPPLARRRLVALSTYGCTFSGCSFKLCTGGAFLLIKGGVVTDNGAAPNILYRAFDKLVMFTNSSGYTNINNCTGEPTYFVSQAANSYPENCTSIRFYGGGYPPNYNDYPWCGSRLSHRQPWALALGRRRRHLTSPARCAAASPLSAQEVHQRVADRPEPVGRLLEPAQPGAAVAAVTAPPHQPVPPALPALPDTASALPDPSAPLSRAASALAGAFAALPGASAPPNQP